MPKWKEGINPKVCTLRDKSSLGIQPLLPCLLSPILVTDNSLPYRGQTDSSLGTMTKSKWKDIQILKTSQSHMNINCETYQLVNPKEIPINNLTYFNTNDQPRTPRYLSKTYGLISLRWGLGISIYKSLFNITRCFKSRFEKHYYPMTEKDQNKQKKDFRGNG